MKKRRKKKPSKSTKKSLKSKIEVPQPFKDITFNRSFVTILLAVLILALTFVVYTHYNIELQPIEYKEIQGEVSMGHECTADLDCPQPRCPGMKGFCENGFCIVRQVGPSTVKCFDLNMPICGNNVCEGDEAERCPKDC